MQDKFNEKETANQTQVKNECPESSLMDELAKGSTFEDFSVWLSELQGSLSR